MMKQNILCSIKKNFFSDPVDTYLLMAAGIIFLDVAFLSYMQTLFELFLVIPCMLTLGVLQGRGIDAKKRKIFLLPLMMLAWYALVQVDHDVESARVYNAGLFFTVYLFAFPLASLLEDGDQKKALKLFAASYVAAAAVLATIGVLLALELLPNIFGVVVRWDGTRLLVFWHSNILACFMLIGTVFGGIFLTQAKSLWLKAGLLLTVIMMLCAMALTNCRTVILVTGGYLGVTLFFWLLKYGKKWFLPGVLAAALLVVGFFVGANRLYQANCEVLERKYIQQSSLQVAPESMEQAQTDAEKHNIEIAEEEAEIPLSENPDTAEVRIPTSSPQSTLAEDMGSLNGRTGIWKAAMAAIRDTPRILLLGVDNPGPYVSDVDNTFRVGHLHNAWIECLVGMGVVGFLIAVAFTVITAWNGMLILLKHHQDVWKRSTALFCLCMLAISLLEPYLFYTDPFYTTLNFLFFLCAGYLVHWQEAENRKILAAIRSRLFRKV